MYIGNVEITGKCALAPMAGVADSAFRALCNSYGAAYTVGEMVSAKGVTLHENEAGTEYLSLDINVATVADYRAAIDFINANSSHHSDCIVTNDEARAAEFLRDVDSAAVYHNVSTRFTDGGEFGMGAEIGISTDKLHARGPMGLEELTTYKYTVTGDGVIRS